MIFTAPSFITRHQVLWWTTWQFHPPTPYSENISDVRMNPPVRHCEERIHLRRGNLTFKVFMKKETKSLEPHGFKTRNLRMTDFLFVHDFFRIDDYRKKGIILAAFLHPSKKETTSNKKIGLRYFQNHWICVL